MPKTKGKNTPGNNKLAGTGKKSDQTRGQFERDPKGRTGQYSGAGDPPLMKK